MAEVTLTGKSLAVSPLKVGPAMGASLAMLGLDRAMPLEHGARGCTSLSKLFFMRHFREPIALQTTAMEQLTTILGADDNVVEALRTICAKDRPEIIGLISTSLSETQGADIPRTLEAFRRAHPEYAEVAIVPVNAPDSGGGLETGYAVAVEAIIDTLVPRKRPIAGRLQVVNVLASPMLTTGDIETIREWTEAFGLCPLILPDLAASLDGHLIEAGYSPLTYGGITRADVAMMSASVATLVIGPSLSRAADALKARTGIDDVRLPHLMGLDACDAFTDALRLISGRPVPAQIERQRSQLLDAMVDCHFRLGDARVAVAADPDLLGQLASFLVGMGVDVAVAVSATRAETLRTLPLKRVIVGDLEDLEDVARPAGIELLIANSHAVQTAERLGVPLLRAGFPQHDYFGGHARTWVGYRGCRQTLFDLANILSRARQPIAPYASRYRSGEAAVGAAS